MSEDISTEGFVAIYKALRASSSGDIAVKLSTGEPGSNYLRTDLIGDLVKCFDNPTILECNTAYGGSRANTAMHYQMAEDYGYPAKPQLIIYSTALGHVALFVRIACCFLCGIAAV